jgi:hypothetical protein
MADLYPGQRQLLANSRRLDCVNHSQAKGSTALGMTQLVSVAVGMGMKLARGVRVTMGMDEIRAEKQRVVVQDF